jgi:hypothetical protein
MIDWNHPRSWDEVCRRHAARRRWNAVRRVLRETRRQRVRELVLELGGLQRGVQAAIARMLGVHRSVISKDLKALWPLAEVCPTCGGLTPRAWSAVGRPGRGRGPRPERTSGEFSRS